MLIKLRYCEVTFLEWGAVTRFPDGAEVPAIPHDTHSYHVIADRLGYGTDVLAYCQHHEFCHHLFCQEVMNEPSYVLKTIANGGRPHKSKSVPEEICAQALQGWIMAGIRPIVGQVDWDGLRQTALRLLDDSSR
jgi:hypothetical protein